GRAPSGCGRSTLLRAVGGLLAPEHGEVRLRGDPVRGVPPDLAIVFQDYTRSLFPCSPRVRTSRSPCGGAGSTGPPGAGRGRRAPRRARRQRRPVAVAAVRRQAAARGDRRSEERRV